MYTRRQRDKREPRSQTYSYENEKERKNEFDARKTKRNVNSSSRTSTASHRLPESAPPRTIDARPSALNPDIAEAILPHDILIERVLASDGGLVAIVDVHLGTTAPAPSAVLLPSNAEVLLSTAGRKCTDDGLLDALRSPLVLRRLLAIHAAIPGALVEGAAGAGGALVGTRVSAARGLEEAEEAAGAGRRWTSRLVAAAARFAGQTREERVDRWSRETQRTVTKECSDLETL